MRTTGWPGRNYRLNPSDEMQLSLPAKERTSVMTSGIWGSYRFAMQPRLLFSGRKPDWVNALVFKRLHGPQNRVRSEM